MKKIYTSYFAKYKGSQGISIARSTPNWFIGRELKELAPPYDLVQRFKNGNIDERTFQEEYINRVLANVNPFKLARSLKDGDVLLCYEKTESFCHRHILSEWLRQYGVEVEELWNIE